MQEYYDFLSPDWPPPATASPPTRLARADAGANASALASAPAPARGGSKVALVAGAGAGVALTIAGAAVAFFALRGRRRQPSYGAWSACARVAGAPCGPASGARTRASCRAMARVTRAAMA